MKVDERGRAVVATALAMVESSDEAMIGMTVHGVITSWNPAATRLYGYCAEGIVGHEATVLFPPSRREEEAGMLRRVAAGEQVARHRTEWICADQTVIAVLLNMSPVIDVDGAVVGVACASRGVDEQPWSDASSAGLTREGPERLRQESVVAQMEARNVLDRREAQARARWRVDRDGAAPAAGRRGRRRRVLPHCG